MTHNHGLDRASTAEDWLADQHRLSERRSLFAQYQRIAEMHDEAARDSADCLGRVFHQNAARDAREYGARFNDEGETQ
jgi:hypothetical protein